MRENEQIEIDLNALVLDLYGDELIFTVTAPPQHGIIILVNRPMIPAIDLSNNDIVRHPSARMYGDFARKYL